MLSIWAIDLPKLKYTDEQVKACIQCRAELPDSAVHCVYCGTVQQGAGPASQNITMMGNPGLGQNLGAASTLPHGQAQPVGAAPLPYGQPQPGAAPLPYGQPQPGAPLPYGQPPQPQAPQYNQPPHSQPQAPYGQPQAQGPYGQPPQAQGPYGQPPLQGTPLGAANFGMQDAQFGAAAHNPIHSPPQSGPGYYQDAMTEQVRPLRAPEPSGNETIWDDALTTQMLVFGVLLVACFVAPWSIGEGSTTFAWSILTVSGAAVTAKILPLLLVGTGLISVVVGALRPNNTTRALIAAAIGITPLVFLIGTSKPFRWQLLVAMIASLILVVGLIARSRHTQSMLARILVTLSVLAILALYLIPQNDAIPLKGLLDQLANMPGKAKVLPVIGFAASGIAMGLIPLFLTLLCLLVWMPSSSRAATPFLIWALLLWPLIASIVALALSEDILATAKASISAVLYFPLAGVAWMVLASFGIAGVIGEQIEDNA